MPIDIHSALFGLEDLGPTLMNYMFDWIMTPDHLTPRVHLIYCFEH